METKFNLYDFLAYLVPGILLLALISPLPLGFGVAIWPAIVDLGVSGGLIFLAFSYVAGHIVQVLLRIRLWPFTLLKTPIYSVYLLIEKDDDAEKYAQEQGLLVRRRFPEGLRAAIQAALDETLPVDLSCGEGNESIDAAWWMVRTWLTQNSKTGYAELYNALANLYRGLAFVFATSAVGLALLTAAMVATILVTPPASAPFPAGGLAWLLQALAVAMLFILAKLFRRQFHYLSYHFAAGVYREFYACRLDLAFEEAAQPGV